MSTQNQIMLQQLNKKSGNASVSFGKFRIGWPKVSQVLYPKQTIRVNTGWSTSQIPAANSITTFPSPTLISNNLFSCPNYHDQSNIGQQIIQVVSNFNDFPVKVDYSVSNEGEQSFRLIKLNQDLLEQELLTDIDLNGLIMGVLGVAVQVLPQLIPMII